MPAVVGQPFNVQHNVNVKFDAAAPTGFAGRRAVPERLVSGLGCGKRRGPCLPARGPRALLNISANILANFRGRSVPAQAGLPNSWEAALRVSGVTPRDVKGNPAAALDALRAAMDGPAALPSRPRRAAGVRRLSLSARRRPFWC